MEDLSQNNVQQNPMPASPMQYSHDNPNVEREDLDSVWMRWKCLVCGYVYEGATPLKTCPKCGNENPDKFSDAE